MFHKGEAMREPGVIQRAPRVATTYQAALTDADGGTIPVIVTDISREGCRLETDGSLEVGEKVEITVDKYGSYAAQIRWIAGRQAGAMFLDPVILP